MFPTLLFYIYLSQGIREATHITRGMISCIFHRHRPRYHRRIPKFLTALAIVSVGLPAYAQQTAVKTNLLYDATATVNLGVELEVAPAWSVDLSGNLNAWSFSHGRRWKHWLVQPEVRYWLCDATSGHFFAAHLLGGQYNFGHLGFARDIPGVDFGNLRDHRYQGWFSGAGVGYGYSWLLGRHWNLEAEIGLGWVYARYDEYECEGCGRKSGTGHKNLFMPTKAALNLVYVF